MNRNYKVIWNRSLGCFTAVAEYAKARGKSSNGTVSSSAAASDAISSGAKLLRLTAICAGIAASGFSMQAMAADGNFDNVTANGDVTATGDITGTNITASGTVAANGGLTVGSNQAVDMGSNKVTNVANGTATKDAVNFGQLEAVRSTANQGFNIKANAGAEEQIGPGETVTFQDGNSNIKITRTGNTISIATSANQNFETVTTSGNATVGGMLNANGGLTVANGKTVSMGNNKVTNVADGTANTDAVNFGQLDAVKTAATTANQGWNIQANGGPAQKIAPGDTVNFKNGNNVVISRNGNAISIGTSPNPSFTTVTTTGNVTVGGVLNANGGFTVASNKAVNMGGNKVTNVANGTIAENGTDAATTGQLWRLTEGGDGVKYFHANSVEADSEALGLESVAIGPNTKAEGASSLAAGDSASVTAQGEGAIALGQNATAGGGAPGSGGAGAVAVGRNSAAAGSSATALGDGARAGGGSATALGNSAQASGGNATALGKSANASGAGAIALGQANARGNDSFAAGNGAETNTRDSIALGRAAGVGTGAEINDSGQRHSFIAIGERSGQNMDGNNAIAIGVGSGSNSKQSNQIAIGTEAGTYLEGERNVSIGFEANKKAVNTEVRHATAIGGLSVADTDAVAVGYGAKAATQSVALGSGAIAKSGSVALGHSSKAVEVTGTSYLTAKAFTGESVSVGNADTSFTRRITNVEDGAADNDAVNVNQLKALKDSLGSFTPEAGGNANYNVDGTLSVAAAKVDGQAVNLGQLNQAVASNKTKFYSVNPVGDSANEDGSGALGANSANSMAIGHAARIDSSQRATAVGYSVIVRADDGTAIGSGSTVDDAAGVAIGKGAYSRGNNSLAMGTDAQTEPKNSNNTLEKRQSQLIVGF
ncbi:ESPR-type extended signal peptide-containing protein [Psychrobacter celer]|uniref:ESPR-type extended signal peptide-containing protein n=1 Tax=Psychrobacter celer TaxID=306572 RepID=UPI003FD49DC4